MKAKLIAFFAIIFFTVGFYMINVKIVANMNNKSVHRVSMNTNKKSNLKLLNPNFFNK